MPPRYRNPKKTHPARHEFPLDPFLCLAIIPGLVGDSTATGVNDSEADLFTAVRAGQAGAWEKLVKRYGALVYSVPRQMGLLQVDAEEVSQATWMIVHRHLHLIEKPRSLAHWLITTASRESWKLQRNRGRREQVETAAARNQHAQPEDDPAERFARLEQAEMVREALQELSARCAELLRALYLDKGEHSYEEVGKALGMPLGSVGPTRLRCLAHLARILEPRFKR